LPQGVYRDAFTGRRHEVRGAVRLGAVFAEFPLSLLVREPTRVGSDVKSGPRERME
jgi:hypothetical protein